MDHSIKWYFQPTTGKKNPTWQITSLANNSLANDRWLIILKQWSAKIAKIGHFRQLLCYVCGRLKKHWFRLQNCAWCTRKVRMIIASYQVPIARLIDFCSPLSVPSLVDLEMSPIFPMDKLLPSSRKLFLGLRTSIYSTKQPLYHVSCQD